MPDLDLKPEEFGERDPKTGRRKIKDDPRMHWVGLAMGLAWLAFVYFNLSAISPGNVFWGAVIGAITTGLFLWPLLSRLDR
jgi:hypothetical protein